MSWFWNAVGAKINARTSNRKNAPAMTRQTSVRMQEFDKGERKTGSLVLTKDDIKAMNIQSRIERTKRKIEHQQLDHNDEIQALRLLKLNLIQQINQRLNQLDDVSTYQDVIQTTFLQEGSVLGNTGDGAKEAEILKQIHKSELMDKSRVLFQQQASSELMEVYKTAPKFKERMGEREAKLLSLVLQKDNLIAQRKELNERILRIQREMIAVLEREAQAQFQKRYEAIRDGSIVEDGDLVSRNVGRASMELKQSYSMRVLSSSPRDIERKHPVEGLREVLLDEDKSDEAHIGEVKPRESAVVTLRPIMSAGRSSAPSTAARRGDLTSRGDASSTSRIRGRPTPPSRLGADRLITGEIPTGTTSRMGYGSNTRISSSPATGARRPMTAGVAAARSIRSPVVSPNTEIARTES